MFLFAIFILAIGSSTLTNGQNSDSNSGSFIDCPAVAADLTVDNAHRLQGLWYEYLYYLVDETASRQCSIGLYTIMGSNSFQYIWSKNSLYFGNVETQIGNATLLAPGLLCFQYTSQPGDPNIMFTILGSDYDNYMILYDCMQGVPRILVNTRTTTPSQAVLNVIYTTIGINNLPVYDLQTTNQELCSYPDFMTPPAKVSPAKKPTTA